MSYSKMRNEQTSRTTLDERLKKAIPYLVDGAEINMRPLPRHSTLKLIYLAWKYEPWGFRNYLRNKLIESYPLRLCRRTKTITRNLWRALKRAAISG